ncbi:MAG: helix-hairpin-helix domain-containing protein [Betaproteobacteria bacterium]|nr:helix-hairpin-helix domain-containing protein [Betaproteobacteria bacterium]
MWATVFAWPRYATLSATSSDSSRIRISRPATVAKSVLRAKGAKSELEEIPSVGPSIAEDLISMGITRVAQLKGRSPEALYKKLCELTGERQDPCVLYTFRCAVYYASNAKHDPEKLKWWNWKDLSSDAARGKG